MKKGRRITDLAIIVFFKDLSLYLYQRIRFFVVVMMAVFEVFVGFLGGVKKQSLQYMFWGRVHAGRFAVLLFMAILVLLLPVFLKRDTITTETYAEEDPYATMAQRDLLIEQGSSQTLIPSSRPRMDVILYVVQRGDTLSQIAEQYNLSLKTLMWCNGLVSDNQLTVGSTLKVPPGDGLFHTVEDGDSLASIAEEYNASEQAIADLNWIDPPNFTISVGQELFIPNGTMPQPPADPGSGTTASYGGTGNSGYSQPVSPPVSPIGRFLIWPVAGGAGYISQCPNAYHIAIDIADPSYPNLVAAAPGLVIFAGMNPSGYAWTVQIDHQNGYSTLYAHMSRIDVSSGQYVGQGQVIGRMGASGYATGVHVHLELRKGTSYAGRISPTAYINDYRVYTQCGW